MTARKNNEWVGGESRHLDHQSEHNFVDSNDKELKYKHKGYVYNSFQSSSLGTLMRYMYER
jgi:hypothetical protein